MKIINSFFATFKKMSTCKRKLDEQIEPMKKRLKNIEMEAIPDTQAIPTPLGIFGRGPMEVIQRIFSYLTVTQLINMASSSKAYAKEICQFLGTKEAAHKFHYEAKTLQKNGINLRRHFFDYGRLINTCGMALGDEQRIQLLLTVFYNVYKLAMEPAESLWGVLFRTVTLKWHYEQRLQFFHSLMEFELRELIDRVVREPLDECQKDRLIVRRKLRGYFLDDAYQDAAFWLSTVIRLLQRPIDQAKLMLTLYAPLFCDEQGNEHLDYNNLSQVDITSAADANSRLSALSTAFEKLIHAVALDFKPSSFDYGIEQLRWNRPEIFNLLEEVTTFPEPWPMQNFVAMLLQSPRLIPIAISYRIIHGFADEAGSILHMLNMLALRWRPASRALVYEALKNSLRMLTSRQSGILFEKTMQEQLKYMQENWPRESNWGPQVVRIMDTSFNSLKELSSMFATSSPLVFTNH